MISTHRPLGDIQDPRAALCQATGSSAQVIPLSLPVLPPPLVPAITAGCLLWGSILKPSYVYVTPSSFQIPGEQGPPEQGLPVGKECLTLSASTADLGLAPLRIMQ